MWQVAIPFPYERANAEAVNYVFNCLVLDLSFTTRGGHVACLDKHVHRAKSLSKWTAVLINVIFQVTFSVKDHTSGRRCPTWENNCWNVFVKLKSINYVNKTQINIAAKGPPFNSFESISNGQQWSYISWWLRYMAIFSKIAGANIPDTPWGPSISLT